jgi:hypothetical protein
MVPMATPSVTHSFIQSDEVHCLIEWVTTGLAWLGYNVVCAYVTTRASTIKRQRQHGYDFAHKPKVAAIHLELRANQALVPFIEVLAAIWWC